MTIGSVKLAIEVACWVIGVSLIVFYFSSTSHFESERREGIELFTQARAAANSPISASSPTTAQV
ncbi:MAG: hypothetical protein ABR550_07485, partial [Wenzhouxiangellaceae bacterium]